MNNTGCFTCSRCGWVHLGVTRAYAEAEVARFNAYFDAATHEVRESFGGQPAGIAEYEHCLKCGASHGQMRPSQPGDCPDGCTIGPIIVEGEQ